MRKYFRSFLTVLSLCLAISLVFANFSFVAMAGEKTKFIKIDKKNAVYDESIGKYVTPFKKVNGELVPVSSEEYLNATKNSEVTDNPIPSSVSTTDDIGIMRDYYEYWRYYPSSTINATGSTKKVTADIYCNTSGGCRISKAVSVTVSASYSVTATAEKNAIKANAGFTWTSSASDTSTYSFSLSNGDRGYIGFRPYLKKTTGTLKKYSNWDGYLYSKYAYAYSPKKTSTGEADGYYLFIHT